MCPRVVRLRRRSGWRRPTSADRVGICRYDTPTHTPIVWACLTTALAHLWVPLEPPNLHANLHQPARALGTDMPDPPSHYSGVATVSGHALGIGGSIMGDPLAPNRVHSRWLGVQVDRQTCRLTPCFLAGRYGLPRGRPECHVCPAQVIRRLSTCSARTELGSQVAPSFAIRIGAGSRSVHRARVAKPVRGCARQRTALPIPWMGPSLAAGLGGPS